MAHSFIVKKVEESPFYREEDLPLFLRVREITTGVRPPGTHGCQLTEIVPGVWTAHFEDIKDPDSFSKLPISPPVGLVVNSAVVNDQCPTFDGYYGPDIRVMPVELYDDPKVGESHDAPSDPMVHFDAVNAAIAATIADGKSVVVHCMASLSRSVCLILAYLIDKHDMSLIEATEYYKSKWDATWPNDGYVFQLIAYQKKIRERK